MEKTLDIHLAEQRKAIVLAMHKEIYSGELSDAHTEDCEYAQRVDMHCTCPLMDLIQFVKAGK